jgi:hypothetical protein
MHLKKSIMALGLTFFITAQTGCDNNSDAQQQTINLTGALSGTFVSLGDNTDTDKDGRPSFVRTYEGGSSIGKITLTIFDEFAQPVPPVNCPQDTQEFHLLRGSFVVRVENGDLMLGVLDDGISCFNTVLRTSALSQNGHFTTGTGQFQNITGTVQWTINSLFTNLTGTNGFASGGSTVTVTGTINPQNGGGGL